MFKHEREVSSGINETRAGAIVSHAYVECKYCNLVASVVVRWAEKGGKESPVSIRVVSSGEIIEDKEVDLTGFISLVEIAHTELDQCGCVPGSPFSARIIAMIESVEE